MTSFTVVAALAVQEPSVPTVEPATQLKEVFVHIVVAIATDSPEPKPVTLINGVIDSSGKPKLSPEKVTLTLGVMVKTAVADAVPSETAMMLGPPGSFGTATDTWKSPAAVVVRHPSPPDGATRLLTMPTPPSAVAQLFCFNHGTNALPAGETMAIDLAGPNPRPVMTRVVATAPDVAGVLRPFVIVHRDTAGVAACAPSSGSTRDAPPIPVTSSSKATPREGNLSLLGACLSMKALPP